MLLYCCVALLLCCYCVSAVIFILKLSDTLNIAVLSFAIDASLHRHDRHM